MEVLLTELHIAAAHVLRHRTYNTLRYLTAARVLEERPLCRSDSRELRCDGLPSKHNAGTCKLRTRGTTVATTAAETTTVTEYVRK